MSEGVIVSELILKLNLLEDLSATEGDFNLHVGYILSSVKLQTVLNSIKQVKQCSSGDEYLLQESR
jgi:hypothetical protein